MEYRVNKRTGDRISVLRFGTSYIAEACSHVPEAPSYLYRITLLPSYCTGG